MRVDSTDLESFLRSWTFLNLFWMVTFIFWDKFFRSFWFDLILKSSSSFTVRSSIATIHWNHLLHYGLSQIVPGLLNQNHSSLNLNYGRLGTPTTWSGSWFHCLWILLEKLCCCKLVMNAIFFILRTLFCIPFWFSCIIGSRSTSLILLKILCPSIT